MGVQMNRIIMTFLLLILSIGIEAAWEAQKKNGSLIQDIDAIDANNAWVVSSTGQIHRWNGTTWLTHTPVAVKDFFDVFMLDSTWGVTAGKNILKYQGESDSIKWGYMSARTFDLRCIWMLDTLNGWAGGILGELVKISNGVIERMTAPVNKTIMAMAFTDSSNGWGVCYSGPIIRYYNGSWDTVTSPVTSTLEDVFCIDSNNCWAAGAGAKIIRWDGTEWKLETTLPVINSNYSINGLFFLNKDYGWAVGDRGTAFKYDGTSWTAINTGWNDQDFEAVEFINENEGWIVGNKYILYTNDGGESTVGISKKQNRPNNSLSKSAVTDINTSYYTISGKRISASQKMGGGLSKHRSSVIICKSSAGRQYLKIITK